MQGREKTKLIKLRVQNRAPHILMVLVESLQTIHPQIHLLCDPSPLYNPITLDVCTLRKPRRPLLPQHLSLPHLPTLQPTRIRPPMQPHNRPLQSHPNARLRPRLPLIQCHLLDQT